MLLTVAVTPATVPTSTGLSLSGHLSALGGDAGTVTIFHVNDTHARLTPHQWIVPTHAPLSSGFEAVGGAAYLTSAMLQLTLANPHALVVDAGDISEGNPLGDMNGNGAMTQFYQLLSSKLLKQRGRGMDAVVVGNHDLRDLVYIQNLEQLAAAGVPVLSMNVVDVRTHLPHFAPYTVVVVNGTRVGILGYTTQAAEVGASLAGTLDVADCDWNSTDPRKIHIASYVNELRMSRECDLVVLLAHVGHSAIATSITRDGHIVAPLLVDDGAAKLPEVVISGHWHTWTSTVWQPEMLNYKTIFAESSSYMKYIGELEIDASGRYLSSTQHVIRNADYAPDSDVQAFVEQLDAQYDTAHPDLPLEAVLGYTADNLTLDNAMRWWSADEYPWSGNNSAGQWICDAMQWKAAQLFGDCDIAFETGGGVRADIPAGPVTYLQVYETFPWADDSFVRIQMTGQEIVEFLKVTNCDAGFSRDLEVTAHDGVPSEVRLRGAPIDPSGVYHVAINNYMYVHPPTGWTWSDTRPLTSSVLCRNGIVDYMRNFDAAHPYTVGAPRYHLNTEFSGGFRAVVTMVNDNDSRSVYEDAFVRLLLANSETLARRGSAQVPADLVGEDGMIDPRNRLSEQELYRSYLGLRKGMLRRGDIIETWGKGCFYGGNPEFVDQEGIVADGVELKIIGHDESLAKPSFKRTVASFWNDSGKNRYVAFLAKRSGASTVVDQHGATVKLWDRTGRAPLAAIAGSVSDLLLVTGVLTMKSYGLRFRVERVVLASSMGVTDFLRGGNATSTMEPVPALSRAKIVSLSASLRNSNNGSLSPIVGGDSGVTFYARYSVDNLNWGSWTIVDAPTAARCDTTYTFSWGDGYYEFYSAATDAQGWLESPPPLAEASTHHVAAFDPSVDAVLVSDHLNRAGDGSALRRDAGTVVR